jgi:hypothetical protein
MVCAEPSAQNADPEEQEPEVVARSGENRVCGITAASGEVVATHAVFVLEMAYYGFDGGPAPEGALDGGGQTAFPQRKP